MSRRPMAFCLHQLVCPWASTQHTADFECHTVATKINYLIKSYPFQKRWAVNFCQLSVMSTMLTNEEHASNFLFRKRIISALPRILFFICLLKVTAIPVQTWTGPEGSRRLRLPDLKTFGS